MNFEWHESELTDLSRGADGDPRADFDVPASRSYDWEKRATEIKERDEYVCQRCEDHNGNYEQYPVSMAAHHIVPGKYLPTSDARIDLNLVTLCQTCHGYLEGTPVEYQLDEIGRNDARRLLTALNAHGHSVHSISRELELSEDRVQSLLSQLERLNCVTSVGSARYRQVCPATANSVAKRATVQWQHEHARREILETKLADLQQAFVRELDDLEYALETGDQEQVESALERLRETLGE